MQNAFFATLGVIAAVVVVAGAVSLLLLGAYAVICIFDAVTERIRRGGRT